MRIFIAIITALTCFAAGYVWGVKDTHEEHFVDGSANYLQGYKLDLPEEISQLNQMSDDSIEHGDNLVGIIDPVTKTIVIGFDRRDYTSMLRDYQLDVHMDTFELWDKRKLIGVGKWNQANKSALDSLVLIDNQ